MRPRQRGPQRPTAIRWNGTDERSGEIDKWARNEDLQPRWQPPRNGEPARVLVDRGTEGSAWEIVPKGALIERTEQDLNAPLRVVEHGSY